MKKQRISVKVADLTTNKGQLGWLPSNPRQWTQDDVERTKKSLETDPDFLEERPILVIKDGKKWIAFAGNLRTTALKELQPYWDEIGVVQYIPETEEDKHTIKRRAMLDNGSFGAWDFDALANEWDDEPLTDWGVPAWKPEPYSPNLDPIDGAKPVTDADIVEAEGRIEDEVTPSEKTLVEVICPHCGKSFQVKI